MPTISGFDGMLIRMYYNDHPPPHFHARSGDFEVTIDIDTRAVIQGQLPKVALRRVRKWAKMNKAALIENWRLCREKVQPKKIEPLG
jgi:Domain of unknown function (DUF4160)